MNYYQKLSSKFLHYCLGIFLLLLTNSAFAETIKIFPDTVISYPRTYDNVTLDLSHGSFIIKNNATLTIKNSNINGTVSKNIPILITLESGKLVLENNQVRIKTEGLTEHPLTQALEYFLQTGLGDLVIKGNTFKIDQSFTAGFMLANSIIATRGFQITNNKFSNFHGVIYLIGSDDALIKDNVFYRNSYGHIVVMGNNNQIIHNKIFFPGGYHLGNAIDLINATNITIKDNFLFTPTCHGLYILNSHGLNIDHNQIYGGITYAIYIITQPESTSSYTRFLASLVKNNKLRGKMSDHITITRNYMSQNRFGLAATDVNDLTVKDNIFIQRFSDNEARKFWTDNNVLLRNVTQLTWENNLYKEAYSQAINGDDSHSSSFVPFPISGGISF